jgi:hypothetical protein
MNPEYRDRASYYDNLPWTKKLQRPRDRQISFRHISNKGRMVNKNGASRRGGRK